MPKDRYKFDEQLDMSRFRTESYDDKLLSTEADERIAARREARKARFVRNSDVNVITPEDISKGNRIRKRKVQKGRVAIITAIFLMIIAVVAVEGIKLTRLQMEKKEVQARLDSLNEKLEQMQDELIELDSDEYVENAARSELHMIKEGEVMYVVDPGSDTETNDESGAKPE